MNFRFPVNPLVQFRSRLGLLDKPLALLTRGVPGLQAVRWDFILWLLSPYDLSCWWDVKHKHIKKNWWKFITNMDLFLDKNSVDPDQLVSRKRWSGSTLFYNRVKILKKKLWTRTVCALTVNSEFFVRVLFSWNFADAEFREMAKTLCPLLM